LSRGIAAGSDYLLSLTGDQRAGSAAIAETGALAIDLIGLGLGGVCRGGAALEGGFQAEGVVVFLLHFGGAAVLGATLITVIIVLSRPERSNYLRGHPQLAILGILVVACGHRSARDRVETKSGPLTMTGSKHWSRASFWYRFLRAYLPVVIALAFMVVLVVRPRSWGDILLIVIVFIIPTVVLLAALEALNWLVRKVHTK
jgi:hypothetical protein